MANDKNTTTQVVNTESSDNIARMAQIKRLNDENENQKELATRRNATPVYAFMWFDKRHVELWGLSQLADETMTFIRKNDKGESIKTRESVIVGKLSTAIMELRVNEKGETKRGAIKPMSFWYIKATQEIGAFSGATQDERDYIELYVSGLMKKHLDGVATIESGDYRKVKGYDSRRNKTTFGTFMSAYMNKKDATQDEIDMVARDTAKATQAVTPVNME